MRSYLFFAGLALANSCALGQSTFAFDQESSTDESPPVFGTGAIIQQSTPLGQSFTPSLTGVDFIRLKLSDDNPNNGLGAALYINLRTDSIGGPIFSSTTTISLQNGFSGVADFFFADSLPLVAGVPYYFELMVQSGDLWHADSNEYNYARGMAFAQGLGYSGSDMWFREGIIVPEPSSAVLILIGAGALIYVRSTQSKKCFKV